MEKQSNFSQKRGAFFDIMETWIRRAAPAASTLLLLCRYASTVIGKKVSQCWQRRNCGSHRQGSFFRSSRSIYQERNLLKSSTLFMLSFAVEVEVRCVLKQSIEGFNVIYKNELHKRLKKWLCRQQEGPSKLCRELCCENT